ncbi:hypothetical protein FKG94_19985 [Exilibacterium tricleocarpae]|uniref:Uncharacterized protein n=1 Tax=Exilibacterium tricleocarpae TaxID=2591008 RepID=A0A545T1T2_9GAMM|nr:hypothetical protein [Exilibacterium tricleocarpae]TQV71170.1 hypothetical protein FKG94_19985 [Exilibacterium tricleocarpae]
MHLSKLVYLATISGFLLLPFKSAAEVKPFVLTVPDSAAPLRKNQGYFLINLDISGAAPSFEFVGLDVRGQAYLEPGQKAKVRKNARKIVVELKHKTNGLYLFAIPEGLYQITSIKAPYFDLPYLMDTEYRRKWRFSIKKDRVNYVGKLFIDAERSTRHIDVKLINRMAADKALIENRLGARLATTPLRSGAGVRDDFFAELIGEQGIR